eukprot:4198702-Alexandrium_andersonii.AAC.1
MSASLVGSEMCIRDRYSSKRSERQNIWHDGRFLLGITYSCRAYATTAIMLPMWRGGGARRGSSLLAAIAGSRLLSNTTMVA